MSPTQSPDPTVFVLFGATGDLSHRMVMPAFYELSRRGLLPENWLLVGNGRGQLPHEDFQDQIKAALGKFAGGVGDDKDWKPFAERLRFAGGGFAKSDPGSLLDVLEEAHQELGARARYIHYLAIPPVAFIKVTEGLHEHDLLPADARVVYEKPYGTSTQTFTELDSLVQSVMKEEQVYRIDHFLGKEATQNLHTLRYANEMFETIWCRDHVDQVQIDVPETLNVDDRAEFYDATGAFRDMIATHLFQVAAEVAMEPPVSMKAADLQDARESVLQAFRPLTSEDVVFGQYEGYRDLPEVAEDSTTDTMAAVRLWVDTDRWRDVPFVLRSGKEMARSTQRVSLIMKKPAGPLGQLPGDGAVISVTLSGSGALAVDLVMKRPGPDLSLIEHRVGLTLDEGASGQSLPPYVALIHDVTIGDRSLFTSSSGLARAWQVADAIVTDPPTPIPYPQGSWGPVEADKLTGHHGWLVQRENAD